jgi:HSP20 family molecular chaperone IbpA
MAPFATIYLDKSFPEHHAFFEHARHKISNIIELSHIGEVQIPRVDIRETTSNYYLDIELPGLESNEDLKLMWIGGFTLLVDAHIRRPMVEELSIDLPDEGSDPSSAQISAEPNVDECSCRTRTDVQKSPIHILVKERTIGEFSRAFNFPVAVQTEAVVAKLKHGLLTVTVSKTLYAPVSNKKPQVERAAF